MLTKLFHFIYASEKALLNKIPVEMPCSKLIVASIITLICLLLVIIIGTIIDRIKAFEYKTLAKASGTGLAKLIVYRLTFPGTVIHEFSHAMFAFMSGAKVTKIQCFSIKKDTLGYVEYQARGSKIQQNFQHGVSACAPVISGIILIPIFTTLMISVASIPLKILCGYMILSIVNHMNMSWPDIKQYVKGIPVLFVIIFAISYISLLTIHI